MRDLLFPRRMWRPRGELRGSYDVVIVGGGVQGLGRMIAWEKEHFVGKLALEHVRDAGDRRLLVGFRTDDGTVPREGTTIVRGGLLLGRVTSSRWSEEVGAAIGLALLPSEAAADGERVEIDVDGRFVSASVHVGAFFDPEGLRLRS